MASDVGNVSDVFMHTQQAYGPDCLPAAHNSLFTSIIIYNKFQSGKFVFIIPPTHTHTKYLHYVPTTADEKKPS